MKKVLLLVFLSLFSCQSKAEEQDDHLSGLWQVEFTHADIGQVRMLLSMDKIENTFEAHTRRDADKLILGGWTSFLGRTFTNSLKEGKLITIDEGQITQREDYIELKGIFRSPIGNYCFNGQLKEGVIEGELRTKNKQLKGNLRGVKHSGSLPLSNYERIVNAVIDQTEQHVYDSQWVKAKPWLTFKKKMRAISLLVEDDLELVFAFYYYAQKLPFSHFALLKEGELNSANEEERESQVEFVDKGKGVGLLTIGSFGGTAAEIEQVFQTIEKHQITDLIVDLRDNYGGSIEAGLTFVNHLALQPYDGGVFLTRKWFDHHRALPTPAERAAFVSLADPNLTRLLEQIHNHEGIALFATPVSEYAYSGKLYVLVNQKTASTCEPLVYALQAEGRAILVGERTAGAMLNSERFSIEEGFTLVLPTATYYTADGMPLDQVGVQPLVAVSSEQALDYTLQQVIKKE